MDAFKLCMSTFENMQEYSSMCMDMGAFDVCMNAFEEGMDTYQVDRDVFGVRRDTLDVQHKRNF